MSARNTNRRTGLVCLLVLGALGGQLAITAGSATAFLGYPDVPSAIFGASGSGPGQLANPAGMAVDNSSGAVYVADQANNRIEKFDAQGSYLAQFTGAETPAGSFSAPRSVAVDDSAGPTHGDVYVVDAAHGVIDVFNATGTYLRPIVGTPSSFAAEPVAVAVDSAGNAWASESNGNVDEFSDTGSYTSQFNTGRGTEPGLALDANENVYLLFGCGCAGSYTASGAPLAEFGGYASGLAVDGSSNNAFLDLATSIQVFKGPNGAPLQTFGTGNLSASSGIAVNATTHAVYASEREADAVAIFMPTAILPDVGGEAVSGVTRTGAQLEGAVNPAGKEVTSCQFEYGFSGGYGDTVACVPAPGSGSSPVAVSAQLSGLAMGSKYHYRLVVANANGTVAGQDATFTTTPAVEGVLTSAASEIQPTSATLAGSLEPNGLDTHYVFEYGLNNAYGASTASGDAGVASGVTPVTGAVSGLVPNTTYHFRLLAENSFGTTEGADESFTTPPAPPVVGAALTASATRTTATVAATVNAENSETSYRVLYGTTSDYVQHSEAGASADLADHQVVLGLNGLTPDTTYHYALTATNPAGTVTSADHTFTTAAPTPPTAVTGGASNIALTSATVSASIDPVGLETSYELDFGTDASYGTSIYGEAGSGSEEVATTVNLTGLAPGSTYHYRIVAINSDGKAYGADQTFATPPYTNPIVLPSTLPLIASPALAFPATPGVATPPAATKSLTKAQKLARTLRACRKRRGGARASCERAARKRYAPVRKHKT